MEDLVQEAFLSVWENLARYRGVGSLEAWVMGIARHKVEDYYRQRLRAPESIDAPIMLWMCPRRVPRSP